MAEYIERQKAIDLFFPVDPENDGSDGATVVCQSLNYSSADIESKLSDMPAEDVAPVRHGKWIRVGYACGETEWQCSSCKETEWRTSSDRLKYRPFCGAKMDLEVPENETL